MKILIIILLQILSFQYVFGQVGTIKDLDGWTNVRQKPNGKSEIIYKVKEGELFWFEFEFDFEKSQWIEIYIPKDKFCTHGYDEKLITGFIHKSRLLVLDELPSYKGSDFKFEYYISEFNKTEKNIKYANDKSPISIDNKHMWGTDGYFPQTEVNRINILINGIKIPVEKELYNDIFNVRKEFNVYKINNLYIVYHHNGDGAGSYELAWVINKDGITQRLVGSMI